MKRLKTLLWLLATVLILSGFALSYIKGHKDGYGEAMFDVLTGLETPQAFFQKELERRKKK